ncbi:PLP-dependent transferase [Conidiobolus coronatus NRRL 28638]|uniref:serine C-palmitoyltransferase n=1 Tax=Conidiobolus coronatus (strain ATCC 28846 / CBS 209.66 / NRRL 28638) TaxID=796925 RepID=A0A137NU90_CONC2|nr:PLP-dependent transferase [Conidiobolus coronatus NRRL 28638]|eukprot:KXN66329.1 PLP-dependent transferase [Conidiobolus coronatus NRRL 28638]
MGVGKRAPQIQPNFLPSRAGGPPSPPASSHAHSGSPFNTKGLQPEVLQKLPPPESEKDIPSHDLETVTDLPLITLITTYISYAILLIYGHLRDFFGKIFKSEEFKPYFHTNGIAPIINGFDSLYHRRLYIRIRDVFNRPITGVAGRTVKLLDRVSGDFNRTFKLTGTTTEVLNLASYNYLGFAAGEGPVVDQVEAGIREHGLVNNSSRAEAGNSSLLEEAERVTARFVGTASAMIISQGFATNSTTIPAVASKGCLILSDEMNHSSIVTGARLSGANIRVFKHNNIPQLEEMLREAISQGQPRTHRPWKKIFVVIEGLYSMEGSFPLLTQILELKKAYKFYIYLDEAHSIGALGPRGRGICDYYGIDPKEIDIMMGTFTKSFGAAGGYIAGRPELIQHLKFTNFNQIYGEPISVPVLQQIVGSMKVIMGEDGTTDGQRRLEQLAFNARYFSTELRKMGFMVCSHPDSPVVPVMLFHPAKIPAFSRECLAKGIAVVVVGYPATPVLTSRVRFCLSASHSKEDLDFALKAINEIGDRLLLKNLW